jgi:hypothetical protein
MTSLVSNSVPTAIAVGAVNNSNPLMFIESNSSEIPADYDVVIGVSDNQQQISLITAVWWQKGRRFFKLSPAGLNTRVAKDDRERRPQSSSHQNWKCKPNCI